jgi:hypothetical protein
MPLGLGRRPGTQGQYNHPTPHTTILRSHFDFHLEQPCSDKKRSPDGLVSLAAFGPLAGVPNSS